MKLGIKDEIYKHTEMGHRLDVSEFVHLTGRVNESVSERSFIYWFIFQMASHI